MNRRLVSLCILLSGLYISANAANVALIPQTGQTSTLPFTAPQYSDGALRKGASWPTIRFTLDTSGKCITDNLTGLMWVKNLNTVNGGAPLTWSTALSVADNGNWCGYDDWRMPNINELSSLVNYSYASPANWLMYGSGNSGSPVCSGVCFANVQAGKYWSSSTATYDSQWAWYVNMGAGGGGNYFNPKNDNSSYRLFPVRGGL